jgi:hypothetical protein
VVALRKSNIKAALRLSSLLNLKKLLSRAALWELFCGGQRESETLRGGEASEGLRFLILFKRQYLLKKEAVLLGVMEYWSAANGMKRRNVFECISLIPLPICITPVLQQLSCPLDYDLLASCSFGFKTW